MDARVEETRFNNSPPAGKVWIWPVVVVAAGLTLTALLVYFARQSGHARDFGRFENAVQRSDQSIRARLEIYIGLLRAGAGFFAANASVTPESFQKFAERIEVARNYPGVQGIGFARRVRSEEKAAFIADMRARGRAHYELTPAGERDEYYPIMFLDPLDPRNRQAIGYDMFSDPTRQEAMRRARDQGTTAVSGRVVLVQEIDAAKQIGFLIYVPLYRSGAIPPTVEERRERIYGFIYSPFRTGDLFEGIFGAETSPRLHFEIYEGEQTLEEHLLYRSPVEASEEPLFTGTTQVQVADRTWTVLYHTTAAFEGGGARRWAWWAALGGALISAMLGAITLALARARARATERGRNLFDQREQFRVTLSSIGDAVIATDAGGRINFLNPVAEKLTGWTLGEARGRALLDVFPILNEETGDRVADPVSTVLRTRRTVGLANHTILVSKNGGRIPIEDSASPIVGEDGALLGVVLVFQDVTERRQAEEALQTSEARKDAILRSALDAIVTIDHTSKFIEFNPAAEQILGYRRDEAIGRSMPELIIPPSYRQMHQQGMARYLDGGEGRMIRRRTEVSAMRADGSEFPAELTVIPIPGANPPIFTAFMRDITDRKRAEQELQEAAERFRFMADSMPAKVFTATPNGECDYFNQRWVEFTGVTTEELTLGGWLSFVHPEEAETVHRRWLEALRNNTPFQCEHRLRGHDGKYRWHLTRAHALAAGDGSVRMWIGSAADIDDKKREEERMEHLVAERTTALREANEQLESFVYAIAHDLRGPLRGIGGFAHILTEDADGTLDDNSRNLLNRIRSSAEFMNRLIDDLLAFGRTARAQMQLAPVDVRKAWDVALAQTAPQIEQAGAHIHTDRDLPRVSAHEATLGQVLANLLSNAIKFIPKGVRPQIWFYCEDRGANVRLWVRDNGIGIPRDQHDRVFRVFERLHGSQYIGTGIGLSIVRKGIERMGGKVGLESEPHHGSKFWIELPRAN